MFPCDAQRPGRLTRLSAVSVIVIAVGAVALSAAPAGCTRGTTGSVLGRSKPMSALSYIRLISLAGLFFLWGGVCLSSGLSDLSRPGQGGVGIIVGGISLIVVGLFVLWTLLPRSRAWMFLGYCIATLKQPFRAARGGSVNAKIFGDVQLGVEKSMQSVRKTPWFKYFIWAGGIVGGLLSFVATMTLSAGENPLVAGKEGAQAAVAGGIVGAVVGFIVDKVRGA